MTSLILRLLPGGATAPLGNGRKISDVIFLAIVPFSPMCETFFDFCAGYTLIRFMNASVSAQANALPYYFKR